MSADVVNGLFALGGAAVSMASAWRTLFDREIKGVHPVTVCFFFVWNLWAVWFYLRLGMWFSVYCNAALALCNVLWLRLIFKYRKG